MALSPVMGKLVGQRVVLASASPRRRDILCNAGLRFEVVPSKFRETLDKSSFEAPYKYAVETAKQKALEVAHRLHRKDFRSPDVVIGADTIVAVEGLILEKPVDKQDAYNMLSRLNGREHSVFTGVAIVRCSSKDKELTTQVSQFHEETTVKFSELSEELLWDYIHSGEPMDKAGGYGIQSLGGMLVESVHGDFLNVVGFPLNRFCKHLAALYPAPRPPAPPGGIPETLEREESSSSLQPAVSSDCQRPLREEGQSGFPTVLLDLIDGFRASKALFVASKLKLFDLLSGGSVLDASEVARETNASTQRTEGLLQACTALGLLHKTQRGYSNTELANAYLVSDSDRSLHGYVVHSNDYFWPVFTHLESAIRGGPGETRDPLQDDSAEARGRLMSAMHWTARLAAGDVVTAFDLSRFRSACDLGGCTGALACALRQNYPSLEVTVFDLPEIIENVSAFYPGGHQPPGITFVSGDFFHDALPEADLYILSRILRDLSEDQIQTLLSRISAVCKPGGGLLVVEMLPDEERSPRRPARAALHRLGGGPGPGPLPARAHYARLLAPHGFAHLQVGGTGSLLDALLALKTTCRH
ncbi:probable bifunctional dTTP/UTP pyrophosphatase/methyltransferase protein [Tachyglossus aculeatus]|uniref:probable bifunctional dTTP/UTP pyrophosphatase/methyltransferase protein n=1 Tax=Tachyglossus aculeatus TaxID=9261 RepID=UPI0018F7B6F6|nr:probable bifunctional dTTP/UTP pyrophosphatase/methyltransferase protein [Tachyglossus aculeatus]